MCRSFLGGDQWHRSFPPTVNTNSTQLYFFEIENPAQYDPNNQSDSPANYPNTNYSADFAIQAPSTHKKSRHVLSASAIAGIAVGGAVGLFLAGFAFWCRLNREKLRNAEETADVSYRPGGKSLFQTGTSELPRTPTTPPKSIVFSDSSSGGHTTMEASPTSMAEILDEDPLHGVRVLDPFPSLKIVIPYLEFPGRSLPPFLSHRAAPGFPIVAKTIGLTMVLSIDQRSHKRAVEESYTHDGR